MTTPNTCTCFYILIRVLITINGVAEFDLRSIRLRKESNEAIITIAYEKRVPLFANLDIVAVFDTTLQ